ncbi:uncharacterized protein MEPE_01340 [Melanopsichium pennsylvanicum]|uniref:Uncharacterized protein n=2 Tax=Melanopsichium pennsylvanicum TaxID=63383 RepID=A0AAJ5C3N0_9BASI|nr:hypothetical protein BN887_05063 [Melanopsichium pennsylvanicum 4]SNX82634.1 uncharacterized protein MEPE_01340 [Melanopsichium pennsylvanicum]
MSPQLPHQRIESGRSNSGSSSVESLRRGAPRTPPQVQLNFDPVAISDAAGFCDFFPWIKQDEAKLNESQIVDSPSAAKELTSTHTPEAASIAAFQQRDAAYLPKQTLQLPSVPESETRTHPLGLFEDAHQMQVITLGQGPRAVEGLPLSLSSARPDLLMGKVSSSSADFYTAAEHGSKMSYGEQEGIKLPSAELRRPGGSSFSQEQITAGLAEQSHSLTPAETLGSPAQSLRQSSGLPGASPLYEHGSSIQPGSSARHKMARTSMVDLPADSEVLDMFEDDKLPGYQVWRRGWSSASAMVVRIPRQMVGWKAVLMDAGGFGDSMLGTPETSKQARRASKVTGRQGWEVRQEALKNSYDFRRGSGILATMHAGHRLFKHDWHVIVKDGSRYMWAMDKHALALYREEGEVKVAEFRKAMPSSSTTLKLGYGGEGNAPDMEKRIGSLKFEGRTLGEQAGAIFDASFALSSLMAVFKARGGHQNVTAAFEPSSDPLCQRLEQERQDAPDREEVMLALPRPGFARDKDSILSDTTDEDAGSVRRVEPSWRSPNVIPPPQPSTHMRIMNANTINAAPRTMGGRKRFSSMFSRGEAATVSEQDEQTRNGVSLMTDSQRIARQYRTQSMFLNR